MHQKNTAHHVKNYLTLILGSAILAFGIYNIHSRCPITEGGILGMNLFLNHWFGISPSISGPIMDMTCFLIGIKFLGKGFLKFSIVSSACFAIFYRVFESFPPLLPDFSQNPFIAALLGALFVGVGVGLVVRIGGAPGGDDAIALTVSKLTKCNISLVYLFTDVTVLTMSLSYIPLKQIAFSLITVTVSSFLIGRIQTFGKPKVFDELLEKKV